MPPMNNELAAMLRAAPGAGDFYVAGNAAMAPPDLRVDGVGPITLPLQQGQLDALLAAASLAPFGRGADTVLDTAVRRTWQVDAARIHFGGRRWQAWLDKVVATAAAGLGVAGPVTAHLYKLLIYDTGSFFVEHRDTEKVAGMFGTLMIVLPSQYEGGALLVRHGGREVRLDLANEATSAAAYAAFYADCVHEVLPVTSGTRLSLVYNLVWPGACAGAVLAPSASPAAAAAAVQLLTSWVTAQPADSALVARKLVYPLEHAYSAAELAFSTLKLDDAAAAKLLVAAAVGAGWEVYLAQMEINESGSAEQYGGWRDRGRRRARWDDDGEGDSDGGEDGAFEVTEIIERDGQLSGWRAVDGATPGFGPLPLLDEELCPLDALEHAEPDEQHFSGSTGNEGASFERTYRRAALVLWPRNGRHAALAQGGLAGAVPHLEQLLGGGATGAADPARRAEALSLATLLVRDAAAQLSAADGNLARMLDCLRLCADDALLEQFLLTVPAAGIYHGRENGALADAAFCLGPARAAAAIERIVAANAVFSFEAVGALLQLCSRWPGMDLALLRPAARALLDSVLGRQAPSDGTARWRHRPPPDAPAVIALLRAFCQLGADDEAAMALAHLLATLDLDVALLPAALALTAADGHMAPLAALRAAALQRLHQRMALDLSAPADWRRTATLACACADCVQLARFLADPETPAWRFAAVQGRRSHIEAMIRSQRCDLDMETVRKGSPHTLLCTKNQASHQRRVRQRGTDTDSAGRLEAAIDAQRK